MNGEGGNFEQGIRQQLEDFSPEVPQSVWDKLSTQLPASSPAGHGVQTGSVSAGVTLVKKIIVAALLGGSLVGVWVLLKPDSNLAPVSEQGIPDQTKSEVLQAEESAMIPTQTTDGAQDLEPKTQPSMVDVEAATPAGQATPAALQQKPSVLPTGPDNQANASTPIGEESASTSANTNGTSGGTVSNPSAVDRTASAPLKLILSARAGFAPLRVTAMSNQQGLPVDFTLPDGTTTQSGAGVSFDCNEPGTFRICCDYAGHQVCERIVVLGRISNAFSPNGDGINERFVVEGAESIDGELRIFTRDGRLLFRTRSLTQGWDGRLSTGEFAPEGTYIFDIFVGSSEAGPIHQKGTLQLFR